MHEGGLIIQGMHENVLYVFLLYLFGGLARLRKKTLKTQIFQVGLKTPNTSGSNR